MKAFGNADLKISSYIQDLLSPEDPILREIRERAERFGLPAIQVGPLDARHLEILVRAVSAKRVVEIGTLAGYSGVSIARALPEGGRLFTFEFNPVHAEVAQESFALAGVSEHVELHVGPAITNLSAIERHGPFDLVFIDADKTSYSAYHEWAALHLRPGGLLVADNTFAWGLIVDGAPAGPHEADARALQHFNRALAADSRFRMTMLPTGEGLAVAVRL